MGSDAYREWKLSVLEQRFADVERRLAALTDAHAPGAWDWDQASDRFIATPRFRDLLGFQAGARLTFRSFREAIFPDDRVWADTLHETAASAFPLLARFRIRRGDTGEVRWTASSIWRNCEPAASAFSYYGTIQDITDQTETAQALVESEERLKLAIEAGKMAVWEVDLETGEMTPSPQLNLLCGFDPNATPNLHDVRALYAPGEIERLALEGATVEMVLKRAVGGAFEPWRRDAQESGRDRTQVQAEVSIVTPAGIPKQLMLRAQYALSPVGRRRLTGLLIDVTDKKVAEQRLAVVARELQHRVKNSLSVVGTIAVQSFRGNSDVEVALQSFLSRIVALASATELILDGGDTARQLRDVVEKIIEPYTQNSKKRFVLNGEPTPIPPSVATALAMVFHELCTNAVKYGALSVPAGEVLIDWEQSNETALLLTWRERNGPQVVTPGRRGFGTRLLEKVVSGQLRGSASVAFSPEGLRCQIEIPIQQ